MRIRSEQQRSRRGYVLLAGAAMAIGLIAFTGLAFDTGYVQLQRSRIQTAADAAVVAAVSQSSRATGSNSMLVAARQGASYNGFVHGQNNTDVTISYPPSAGRYAGDNRWIEAKVSQRVPSYFLRIIGQTGVDIAARAVAKAGGPGDGCVFVLNPTVGASFDLNGNGSLDSCGIMVNSTNAYAANINGSYYMKLSSFRITGGYWLAGGSMVWEPGSFPITGQNPIPDPLWYVNPPAVPAGCDYNNTQFKGGGTKKATLNPGVYCGGISVSSGWELELNPGVYILKGGGFDTATNSSIRGEGVTIYNTYDAVHPFAPITINGNNTSDLRAPKSGPLEAILIFQDRTAPAGAANYIRGSSAFKLDGAIYLPTQKFEIRGTSSHKFTIVVADTVEISGTTVIKADYSELTNGNPMLSKSFVFGE